MKKAILFLLCISSVAFAKGPTTRHRVPMPSPDPIVAEISAQDLMKDVLELVAFAEKTTQEAIQSHFSQRLIEAAKVHIGARYRSGSCGPKAFDCSGFTSYVFKKLGITLKRSSREQSNQGENIANISELKPGDLVFFGRGSKRRVNHVGIVTEVNADNGTFNFIHSSTSQGVRIDSSTDGYWMRRFINGRRVLENENKALVEK